MNSIVDFVVGVIGGLWFTVISGPIAIYVMFALLLPFGGWKLIELGYWSPKWVFKASCALNGAIGIGSVVASFNEDLDPEARELFTLGHGLGYLAAAIMAYLVYSELYENG